MNIKKKDVKFLPKLVDETFSLAGYIKKEKLKGKIYYVFYLGKNNFQIYQYSFEHSIYIEIEPEPERIAMNSIKRLEKKNFISKVDITIEESKYQRIN